MPKGNQVTEFDRLVPIATQIRQNGADDALLRDLLLNGADHEETGEELFPSFPPDLVENFFRYQDFELFAAECLKIRTKEATVVPFVLNRAQRHIWRNVIKPDLEDGVPVRIYILKARQLGFTTLCEALGYWWSTLNAYVEGICIAHDSPKASDILEMGKLYYQLSPEDFRPTIKRSNRNELFFANPDDSASDNGLRSRITVATADNDHLGASKTIQFVHASEYCRYPEVNKGIQKAMITLRQSVPDLPGTFIILESTARGPNYSKDVWDDPNNDYRKIFVSWVADDKYTIPLTELDLTLESINEVPHYGNERLAYKRIYQQLLFWYPEYGDNPLVLRDYALCRLQWRREKIRKDCEGDVEMFQQEYPTTAEEAFITTSNNVFYAPYISHLLKIRDTPIAQLGFDFNTELFESDSKGELLLYRNHSPSRSYVFGVDIGSGLQSQNDDSVIQVFDDTGEQAAVWRGGIDPFDLALICYHLAAFYSGSSDYDTPFVIPEANSYGQSFINRFTGSTRKGARATGNLGYRNVYKRKILDKILQEEKQQYGFFTTVKTKPMLITRAVKMVRSKRVTIHDEETLEQLLAYEIDEKGAYNAPKGMKDDCVIACALAWFEQQPAVAQKLSVRTGLMFEDSYYKNLEMPKAEARSDHDNFLARLNSVPVN